MLKDMGMSLQDIRAFLALPDMGGAVAVLKRQQEILRERQAQLKEAMARLDHKVLALEAMADAVPGRITLEELPAVPLAVYPVNPPGGVLETDLALKSLLRTLYQRRLPFVYEMGTRIAPGGPGGRPVAACLCGVLSPAAGLWRKPVRPSSRGKVPAWHSPGPL